MRTYREDEILGMIGRATTAKRRQGAYRWLLNHREFISPDVWLSASVRLLGYKEAKRRGLVK